MDHDNFVTLIDNFTTLIVKMFFLILQLIIVLPKKGILFAQIYLYTYSLLKTLQLSATDEPKCLNSACWID